MVSPGHDCTFNNEYQDSPNNLKDLQMWRMFNYNIGAQEGLLVVFNEIKTIISSNASRYTNIIVDPKIYYCVIKVISHPFCSSSPTPFLPFPTLLHPSPLFPTLPHPSSPFLTLPYPSPNPLPSLPTSSPSPSFPLLLLFIFFQLLCSHTQVGVPFCDNFIVQLSKWHLFKKLAICIWHTFLPIHLADSSSSSPTPVTTQNLS